MLGTSLNTMGGVASVARVYRSRELFSRWPITYVATHVDGGTHKKLLKAFAAWWIFSTSLLRYRNLLLHVHCASRASFWRKAAFILPAAWTGNAVIFHLHGAEFMQFYHDESGPLAQRMIRYVLNRCTRIVVLSESWRADLSRITTKRIDVIANPALPLRRDSESGSIVREPKTLLFLGRLGRRKGIYVLLHALAKAKEQHPDVRLLCGGDGELDEVRILAGRLGLGDNIAILGWVDEDRRTKLLAEASIYVLPSYAEGLPMSVLEAMSAGLPVIATPVGGIPEAIEDGKEGLLVPPGDSEALADAICRLLGDRTLREEMGSRGRAKFDACYDASVVIPRLEAMYRELGVMPAGSA